MIDRTPKLPDKLPEGWFLIDGRPCAHFYRASADVSLCKRGYRRDKPTLRRDEEHMHCHECKLRLAKAP